MTPRQLLNTGGSFKINSKFVDFDETDDLNPEFDDDELLCDPIPSPWELPFDDLRALMKPLPPPNETIFRKLVREGNGAMYTPGQQCRMTIQYSSYWQGATQPFDSTFLRGRPVEFHPGKEEILLGVELATLTMRVGEESQFVIPYQFLFGELGCPERIQPKADGLYSIQLLSISEVGDETSVDQISAADRTKFSVVMPKVMDVYTKAKDLFARGEVTKAIHIFHKAVNSLETCRMNSDEEQLEQQEFLVKMYTNLAVCYNKIDKPRKACSMCNEIGRISKIGNNCKALFQHGRALLKLGEFRMARIKLTQAQRLQPSNMEIGNELNRLSTMLDKHAQEERAIWQRAFGNKDGTKTNKPDNDVDQLTDSFAAATLECLQDFEKNSELRQMTLPVGLSKRELDCVANLISDKPIEMEASGSDDKEYFVLRKVNLRP